MASASDTVRDTAREFATRVANGDAADAAELLSEPGAEAVVDSFPDGFQQRELDTEDALEQYWYGLYGQYGDFEGVETVAVTGGEAIVELGFANGTQTLELGFVDGAVADICFPTAYEPPLYADRDAFTERDVTVDASDVALDGVLAVPDGGGPFPGVVLVHGAGIHDPDGTAGASKVLRDFAWGLASAGIATLRYEKRLRDHEVADGEYTLDTVVVDDALAAVDELASTEAVAEESVFVAGHSQGGMCAPRIAARHGGVAGVVNLDGRADSTLDPDDLAFMRYEFEPDGDLDDDQEARLDAERETVRRIAAGDFEDDDTLWGKPGTWHRSVGDYDPSGAASSLDCPVFVAKGGRADEERQPELVAWLRSEFEKWRDLDLPDGSRVELYEGVDHYFQDGPTPVTMAHLYFGGNVAEYVVDDLAAWVRTVADA